jgi:hypothetical protein
VTVHSDEAYRRKGRWDVTGRPPHGSRDRRAEDHSDEAERPRRPRARERDGRAETADRDRTDPAAREDARIGAGSPTTAEQAARLAARYVHEMTGREPETIISLERTDDGRWRVGVEVVETRRIPDSTDILAVYEVQLDDAGELVAYQRTRRYSRCQVEMS